MALDNDVIIKNLENFFLNREEIVFAWLFGSYAEKNNNRHSDLDIAVYVKDGALLSDTDWYLGLKAELMVFTNKEIDLVLLNLATPLVKHIANIRNIVLLSRDPVFEAEYSLRIIHEYNDVRYWARKTRERLLER